LYESPGVNTERILEGECDAALIGPIEYARNSSDFSLYPSIGVSSRGESRTVVLCINRNIRKIATVAIGLVSSSDIVLAKIVLAEKFEQEISFVPVIGTVDQMLAKADAALLTGNAVLTQSWSGPRLDLVDEWSDMTDLPFVHNCCAARTDRENHSLKPFLLSSQEEGTRSLSVIARNQSIPLSLPAEMLEQQLEYYTYGFDEDSREALGEFYRYAFYLGVLPDVPEINVFGS